MNADVRSKLEMAERVMIFIKAFLATNTEVAPVFKEIGERTTRGRTLIALQRQGREDARTANATRSAVREKLTKGIFRLMSRAARAAAEEDPSLGALKAPGWSAPNVLYGTAGEALVTEVRARLEVLGKYGLSVQLVEDAEALIDQFRVHAERAKVARAQWVQAGAELEVVMAKLMTLVERIHGLVRHLFANQPDVLASWESARRFVTMSPRSTGLGGTESPAA